MQRSREPPRTESNPVGLQRKGGKSWIWTLPGSSWFVWLRLFYGPEQSWFDETWRPSEIEEVKSANHPHGRDWPGLKICCIAVSRPELGACGYAVGFGAIAMGIGVAMLHPML